MGATASPVETVGLAETACKDRDHRREGQKQKGENDDASAIDTNTASPFLTRYRKKATVPFARLYIAPLIWIDPFFSRSRNTGLRCRMFSSVNWTLLRATAST